MTHRTRIVCITALTAVTGLLCATPTRVTAQATAPAVAVMVFNVRAPATEAAAHDGVGTAIADLMGIELASQSTARVLDVGRVQRAIDARRLPRGGMIDRNAAVEIGRQLGAAHVVYGSFAADATGNVRLDARGVNVATGAVEFTERMQDRADVVVALVSRLAGRMRTGMSLPAGGGAAGLPALPLRSLVQYGKALDLADHGSSAQAVALLDQVLKDFPGFTPATAALSRLKSGS